MLVHHYKYSILLQLVSGNSEYLNQSVTTVALKLKTLKGDGVVLIGM
jgi:hypothetical protein